MIERLSAEKPFWEPGSRNGYHMITFGWTVGELVRRVSGMSLGQFFQKEIAGPTNAEVWLGLPEALEPRVSKIFMNKPDPNAPISDFVKGLIASPESIQCLATVNMGGWDVNSQKGRAAEIGGGGGISNARGLSRMFIPLSNQGFCEGKQIFKNETIATMGKVSVETDQDMTLLIPTRFALGFMKGVDNRNESPGNQDSSIIGENAFGHIGAGVSFVFADPDYGVSMAYTMNKMGPGLMMNDRGQPLVDSIYGALKKA